MINRNLRTSSITELVEDGRQKEITAKQTEARDQSDRKPPGSPVNLFVPDGFQFYTLNSNGQLVMKQMTQQEIQGMIAGGGGSLPVDMGVHQAHLVDNDVGETKVCYLSHC